MPKFTVDLWLDGYDSEEEMAAACEEFIYNQLNFSGSSVEITRVDENNFKANSDQILPKGGD